ncbi:PiggyBac transposable element-derived protein 4-like 11 [Homarus americanus]|uniref:PiggyBac transposable element-derived protein 4-like 11 n=1 Tax=Homarus americanus TaxID=6706 RepID=A0A8J5TJI9_HOMAM|nr:PiggyBac transposable element-derived protein 4-like 11 [Homarus americanus]
METYCISIEDVSALNTLNQVGVDMVIVLRHNMFRDTRQCKFHANLRNVLPQCIESHSFLSGVGRVAPWSFTVEVLLQWSAMAAITVVFLPRCPPTTRCTRSQRLALPHVLLVHRLNPGNEISVSSHVESSNNYFTPGHTTPPYSPSELTIFETHARPMNMRNQPPKRRLQVRKRFCACSEENISSTVRLPTCTMSNSLPLLVSVTPQMSSSTEDSEYEPSLRSLNTSDNSASSSDNDYFSTSEEEEEEGEGRAWRSLELSEERMNTPPPRFPFTGNPGIKIDENPAELSPFEFFSLFIDKRIIDSVLVETNRFAEQTGQDDSLWRPVTEAELFVFFAMKMLGGIVKMPEEEMNWSHDELLERPIFRQLMTMKWYKEKTTANQQQCDSHHNCRYRLTHLLPHWSPHIVHGVAPSATAPRSIRVLQ